MAWAYAWAVASGRRRAGGLLVPAVLILGVLPDIDLFFPGFVKHHTVTHSLFFWLVMFAPILAYFRLRAFPYLVAVVQHFAFGDLLVGDVMILWPFSRSNFGFNYAMPSVPDVALETAGLMLAAGITYFSGDVRRLLSADAGNLSMYFPFTALLASMLFFAVDWPIVPLIAYIWSRKLLTVMVLGHLILAMFLAVSMSQGLRGFIYSRGASTSSSMTEI